MVVVVERIGMVHHGGEDGDDDHLKVEDTHVDEVLEAAGGGHHHLRSPPEGEVRGEEREGEEVRR